MRAQCLCGFEKQDGGYLCAHGVRIYIWITGICKLSQHLYLDTTMEEHAVLSVSEGFTYSGPARVRDYIIPKSNVPTKRSKATGVTHVHHGLLIFFRRPFWFMKYYRPPRPTNPVDTLRCYRTDGAWTRRFILPSVQSTAIMVGNESWYDPASHHDEKEARGARSVLGCSCITLMG